MNRADRMFAIVLELQRHGQRRAEDLAETLEVSKRTIYRDIQSLSEAGIPLIAMTGYGYSLIENYFLPPVNFSTDEALMLILGSDVMQQNFDAKYRRAAQSATTKIETILPKNLQEEIQYLRENFTFFGMKDMNEQNALYLSQIRRAMIERQCIKMTYTKRIVEKGNQTSLERIVAPYSLASLEHDWYLMGYCYLRQDIRVFRLNRIDRLELVAQRFKRPQGFIPQWEESNRPKHVTVRLHVDYDIIRWVRESRPYSLTQELAVDGGWELSFRVQNAEELLRWILGWGKHIQVLEPESLQTRLMEETMAMLNRHQT